MCVSYHPSERQHSALSISLESTTFEVENNPALEQSASLAASPVPDQEYVWGWKGNLSFVYWNETLNQGIENATVQYWWAYLTGLAIEIGNGTYYIPIDTSLVYPGAYYPLVIFASKIGHEPVNEVSNIFVHEVPTDLVVYVPTKNQVEGDYCNLFVPYGDSINITLFYNDTDSSDGYVGGIHDAGTTCQIGGTTLPMSDFPVTDLGNGNYCIQFDSTDPNLYITTGGEPVLSPTKHFHQQYTLFALLHSQNRSASEITLRIEVCEVPTEFWCDGPYSLTVWTGDHIVLELWYMDTWHDLPISNASVSINCSDPDVRINTLPETNPGMYRIEFAFANTGNVTIAIFIEKDFYCIGYVSFDVVVETSHWPPPPPNPFLFYILLIPLTHALRGHTSRVGWSRQEKLQGFLSVIIAVLIDVHFYFLITPLNIPLAITAIIGLIYCFWIAIGKGAGTNVVR